MLPLVPLASSELPAGTQVVAQLPLRVSSRATGPLTIAAKLTRDGAAPQSLDAPAPDVKPFAAAGGSVYTVALPANLGVGNYRLVVEAALGREKATREVRFRVVGSVSLFGRQPLVKRQQEKERRRETLTFSVGDARPK